MFSSTLRVTGIGVALAWLVFLFANTLLTGALYANLFYALVVLPYVALIYLVLYFFFFSTGVRDLGDKLIVGSAGAIFGTGIYFACSGVIMLGLVKCAIAAGVFYFIEKRIL